MMEGRQEKERELHDHLRGDLVLDRHYQSNKKFYSINQSNKDYVKRWLSEKCYGKRVLDYCCGNGEFAIWLAEVGAEAYGIDISPVSIRNAQRHADVRSVGDKVRFEVMDAEATNFPENYFDFIVVNGVLHHLDLRNAYKELARILKPEGQAICTEALRHNFFIHLYRKMTPHLRSGWEIKNIMGKQDVDMGNDYFDSVDILKFFHLATIGAVPFRNLSIFETIRRGLEMVDSVLLKLPVLRWQAWMTIFVLSQPKKQI